MTERAPTPEEIFRMGRDADPERAGADFGARTAAEYEQMAARFLTGPRGATVLDQVRPLTAGSHAGDTVRFDTSTQEFGVISIDGVIRTYFRPDPVVHGYPTNLEYYLDQ